MDISSYVIAYEPTTSKDVAIKQIAERFAYDLSYYTGARLKTVNFEHAEERMILFESGSEFLSVKGKDGNIIVSSNCELGFIYATEALFADYFTEGTISLDVNSISINSYKPQTMAQFLTYTAFETKYMRLNVGLDGRILGIYDKATGDNYAGTTATYIATITKSGNQLPTKKVEFSDVALFIFDNETALRFKYEVADEYLTLELLDDFGGNVSNLSFFNFNLSKIAENFSVIIYSLAYQTNPVTFPDGKSTTLGGIAYSKFHPVGSKLALIAGPKSEHRAIMKRVNETIDKTKVGYSPIGGANAMDHPGNYYDYMIVADWTSAAVIDGYIDLCNRYDIDLVDFHRGGSTFLNGTFDFIGYKDAADFRANVTDKLKANGIEAGLHVYSHLIEDGDKILTDPKWQQQVGVLSKMKLAEDMRSFGTIMKVDDSSKVVPIVNWAVRNSIYLLIDEEIVAITTYGENEFNVKRGAFNTKAADHKAGAEVRHLDGVYGMVAPDFDSELYLQVARNIAKAVDEGGFSMIYFDAFDGVGRQVPHNEIWYYCAKFVNEIYQNCKNPPMMESAMGVLVSTWISYTKPGAWDYPTIGYKPWNRMHVDSNDYYSQMYLPTTLGWYNFAPGVNNISSKYQYFDDLDYMGSLAIAYDMSNVYNPAPNVSPAYARNASYYAEIYSTLRKSNYFSEEIKKIIRDTPEKEYAVMQKTDGSWAFFEKFYAKQKLYDITIDKLQGVNPFDAQKPFIRIEGHQSSDGSNERVLVEFENLVGKKTFEGETDISNTHAFIVNVLGNNSDDAIGIRVKSESMYDDAVWDYAIKLDFEGWREFILVERENGSLEEYPFPSASHYALYRGPCEYGRVSDVTVYKFGTCDGVEIESIVAATHLSNPLKNPTVKIGDTMIKFETEIGESQYLEYFPGETTAKLYSIDGTCVDVSLKGEVIVPAGEFTAVMNADAADLPLRATITFGFTGAEVK